MTTPKFSRCPSHIALVKLFRAPQRVFGWGDDCALTASAVGLRLHRICIGMGEEGMNSIRAWLTEGALLVTLAGMMTLSGCTGGGVSAESAASAQQSYDQALEAFEAGRLADARPLFDASLTLGGLPVDLVVDAYLKRSMCAAEAQDFAAAEADIATAEQGAMEMDQVHVARGFLLKKQGDQAGADAEFAAAKKLNPKVVLPK